MPYDPNSYNEWLRARTEKFGVTNQPEPAASLYQTPKPSITKDLLMAPLRGVEGMAQDAWGLLDTVAFDALPDYDTRLLGESKTMAGSLAEGIFTFLSVFIPGTGLVKGAGWIGKAARAGKLVKGTGKASQLTLKGDLAVGAVADLIAFSKADENLSTLIQSFPALANPVTAFLATEEDDEEIVGRIKNVLEGAALGVLMEPFMAGLRALRKGRSTVDGVRTPDEIAAELAGEVDYIERGLAYRVPDWDLPKGERFWVDDPSLTKPEELTKEGTIVGSPKLTPEAVAPIRRLMLKAAQKGEVGRYWYEESSRAIYQIVGGDMEKAEKLARALAVTSPGTAVKENAQAGLQGFHLWNRGVPLDEFLNNPKYRIGMREQQLRLARALYGYDDGNAWYGGRKVYNFYTNLMREMDPGRAQGVTNDMWMARLFGFASDGVDSRRPYDFMQREVESIADQLGWEPYQVQASMWTYTKALWEANEPAWRREAEAAGMTTTTQKGGVTTPTKEYAAFQRERFKAAVAQDIGLGADGFKVEDSYSFLQALHEKPIVLSHEVLPFNYPFEAVPSKERIAYSAARRQAFIDPETGIDEVSKEIGWGPKDYPAGSGGLNIPSTTPKGGEGARSIEEGSRQLAEKWGYLHAVVSGQREVFMVRTWDTRVTGAGANAIKIDLGRPVTTADSLEALHLMDVLGLDPETVKPFSKNGALYFARVDGKELKLDAKKARRLVGNFNEVPVNTELWNPRPVQQFTSASTDVNTSTGRVPALFNQIEFEPGTVNVDIGGGKGGLVTEALAGKQVTNKVFDPFNRTPAHNRRTAAVVANGRADTATISNVLNVIQEPRNRALVIRQAADALKPNGKAYFSIYAGAGDGIGGPTPKGWQNNLKAEQYVEEISRWFDTVERRGQTIIASGPKPAANPVRLAKQIEAVLSEDLLRPEFRKAVKAKRGKARRVCGHCYASTEAVYHAIGGKESGWMPMQIKHEGTSHWFLKNRETDEIIDITADQFITPVPYSAAKGKGFLTAEPSSRAKEILKRVESRANREYEISNAYAEVFHDAARTPEELRARAVARGYGDSLERVESRVQPRLADADAKYGYKPRRGGGGRELQSEEAVRFLRDPDGAEQTVEGIRRELDDLARESQGSFFVTHGSGKEFQTWNLRAGRTAGSGGDAYGHGAYAAEAEGVSRSYQTESGERTFWVGGEDLDDSRMPPHEQYAFDALTWATASGATEINWDATYKYLSYTIRHLDTYNKAVKALDRWRKAGVEIEMPGYHYTFEVLGDKTKDFIQWDEPLHKQPFKAIQGFLTDDEWAEIGPILEKKRNGTFDAKKDTLSPEANAKLVAMGDSGAALYKAWTRRHGTKAKASRALRAAGVKGNRYADRVTRMGVDGIETDEATFNYVMFSSKDFKVKRRTSGVLGQERVDTFYADFDTLAQQLDKDVQIGAYNHPRDVDAVQEFVRRVGSDLFNGVSLRVAMTERASSYEFITKTVSLGGRAIKSGEVKRDLLHELWHHLSTGLEPRYRRAVEDAYRADLAQAIAKDPSLEARIRDKRARLGTDLQAPPGKGLGNAEYRYLSSDEWFAEVMTDRSLDKLALFKAADQPGMKGIIAHARLWWTEMVNAMRARFGGDRTHKLLDDFLRGRREVKMRDYYGVGGIEQSKMWKDPDARPAPAAVLRHLGIDSQQSEDIAADIAQRLKDGRDPALNPRNLSDEELIFEGLRANDLNLSRWAGRDDGLTLLRVVEDLYGAFMETDVKSLNRPQSFDAQTARAVRERAAILGEDPETSASRWRATMRQDQANLRQSIGRIWAHKTLLMGLGEELAKQAKLITKGEMGVKGMAEFAQSTQFYSEMLAGVKGLQAEVGRGLGFMRRNVIPFDKIDLSKQDLDAYIAGHGGQVKIEKLAEQINTAFADGGITGTASAARIVQATWRRKGISIFNEYWINALLSGPRTLVVNFLSGATMSIYRPLELMLGASIHNLRNLSTSSVFTEAFEELTRITNVFGENTRMSFKLAVDAFDDDVGPVLTGRAMFDDRPRAQMHAISSESETLWGSSINWLGRKVRLPTRFMASGDEYIKQMNYRAVAQTHFSREARLAGKTGDALAKHVQDGMDRLIYEGQAYSQDTLYKRGLDEARAQGITDETKARDFAAQYVDDNWDDDLSALSKLAQGVAEEVTFTTPLREGSLSQGLQKLVNAHPMLRIVLPFIRTPVNIAGFAHQRLNPAFLAQGLWTAAFPQHAGALQKSRSKIVQGLLSSDKRTQAEAFGRLGAGLGFYALGSSLAMQGIITGRGPSDPQQRKVLEAEGWIPYSIRTADGYIQYNRMDPFGTLLGVFADTVDYMKFAPPDNDEALIYAPIVAIANNFTNKTYLTGIRNMVEALTDPDRKAAKWLQRQTGSMIPNVLGQAVSIGDEDMREVRTLLDAALSKVPGLSETLAPQRNVLGEVVPRLKGYGFEEQVEVGVPEGIASFTNWWQPIYYRSASDDVIGQEMAMLGHGWTPPKTMKNGIDLTGFRNARGQDAYDRWGELQGTLRIGNKTLRESLRKMIQSKAYQSMTPESTPFADSPRIQAITNVITRYRRRAYTQLKREFPDIAATERDIFNQRREAKYGSRARRILER